MAEEELYLSPEEEDDEEDEEEIDRIRAKKLRQIREMLRKGSADHARQAVRQSTGEGGVVKQGGKLLGGGVKTGLRLGGQAAAGGRGLVIVVQALITFIAATWWIWLILALIIIIILVVINYYCDIPLLSGVVGGAGSLFGIDELKSLGEICNAFGGGASGGAGAGGQY